MLKEEYDAERLQYLARLVAEMHVHGVDIGKLGNIALELLVTRSKIEEIVEGKFPRAQRERAKKTLLELKDLEKSLVSLYAMGVFGYVLRGYPHEHGRR